MKTILFTNARDEDSIYEWVIHHKNLGFTEIYIYDHLSINPIEDTLQNIPDVLVDMLDSEEINKVNLMKISVDYAKKNDYDWLLYLDADEFLILPKDENINTFLQKYEIYQQIGMNWVMFGSNFHHEAPKGTMLESYTKSAYLVNSHIKSFVKPKYVIDIASPHAYITLNMELSVGTKYEKYNIESPHFIDYNISCLDEMNKMEAYIAHFVFQAYEIFLKRKCLRKRDDNNLDWNHPYDNITLHHMYNQVDNFLPRDRYNNKNKEKMKLYKV
jgi:hypothetical protein